MQWRPLPADGLLSRPVQWVGHENGEDVAWITQGRRWGEPGYRWLVATPHGSAFGRCPALQGAQRLAEAILREHGAVPSAAAGAAEERR